MLTRIVCHRNVEKNQAMLDSFPAQSLTLGHQLRDFRTTLVASPTGVPRLRPASSSTGERIRRP